MDLVIAQIPSNSKSQWFKKVKWEKAKANN